MSDIRKNPLSNTWVIIAPERGARPQAKRKKTKKENGLSFCPFCENPDTKSAIAPYAICAAQFDKEGNWITRVLRNKYPALSPETPLKKEVKDEIFERISGVGGHEILIESPIHKFYTWATMPREQLKAVLRNYRCRYTYWRKDPRVEYLSIFRNYGRIAGASIKHPHSQMIATPIIPPILQKQLEVTKKFYNKNDKCLICKMLKLELKNKERLIIENDDFAVVSTFAPRFPFETLIIPKKHKSTFEDISDNQIASLAKIITELFKRFDKLLNDPPFNLILHVSPLKKRNLKYYHYHIEIIMRLSQPAGFEWGSGIYINSLSPELAAKQLREIKI